MNDLRKAAEMALEQLESHDYWADEQAIQALRQALAQPKREWVGLSESEVMHIWYENGFECMIYAKAIEAKLKEKNNG